MKTFYTKITFRNIYRPKLTMIRRQSFVPYDIYIYIEIIMVLIAE